MVEVLCYIPYRMLSKFTFDKEIEAFAIEIKLRKFKWVLFCFYKPIFLIYRYIYMP